MTKDFKNIVERVNDLTGDFFFEGGRGCLHSMMILAELPTQTSGKPSENIIFMCRCSRMAMIPTVDAAQVGTKLEDGVYLQCPACGEYSVSGQARMELPPII